MAPACYIWKQWITVTLILVLSAPLGYAMDVYITVQAKTPDYDYIFDPIGGNPPGFVFAEVVGFTPRDQPAQISPHSPDPGHSTVTPLTFAPCPVDTNLDGIEEIEARFLFYSLKDLGQWTIKVYGMWMNPDYCENSDDCTCGRCCNDLGLIFWPETLYYHVTVENRAPDVTRINHSPSRPKWCETVTLSAQSRAGGTPYDPDGGTLDYYWTATRPNGNSMTLNVNAPEVTIPFSSLNDRGLWTIQLHVDDDEGERISLPPYTFHVVGTPPSITLSGNNPKTGDWLQVEAQTVETDTCDEITFNWEIIQAPEPRPDYPPPTYVVGDTWQHTPTVSWQTTSGDMGVWQFQCVGEHKVTGEQGEPRSIYVRVENRPPEIHLTTGGEKIAVDEAIWADGSGSTDPDGGHLTFQWDIIQAPQDAPALPDDVQAWNGFSTQSRLEIDPHYDNAGTWIFRIIVTDVEGDTNEGEVLYPVLVDAIPTAVISDTNDPYSAMETITLNGGDSIDPDPGPPPCPVAEPNYCHKTIDGRPAKISDGVINYYWELIDVPSELWEDYPTGPVDEVFHLPADSPLLTLEPGTLKTGDWTFALHVWDGEGNTHRTDRTITVVDPSTPPLAILNQWARYTTDINGVLNEDIGLIGTKSFDMDNLLAEDLDWPTPGLGIDYYQWEILQSPSGCNPGSPNWPWPVDPSGEEADTTNLYNAGDNIDPGCQGFWKIGLTVTDDEDMTGSAGTEVIIGNCPQPLCIDSPTNLNPEYVEFTEYTDIFIHYHLDSSLYMETDPNGDMIFAAGMFTMLEIFHQSDPTTPVYTSLDPNVLGSDKGGRLVFQWNGYTNTMQRPQPGRYSIKITLLDYLLGLTNFVAMEPDAIWVGVSTPEILPTSDRFIGMDNIAARTDKVTVQYKIVGAAVPDEIRWRILDDANQMIHNDTATPASTGTIEWEGWVGTSVASPGRYTFELEAGWVPSAITVIAQHPFAIVNLDLDMDVNEDTQMDDTDEPLEMNTLTDTPPGPYAHLNSDNDNGGMDAAGNPIPDKNIDGPIPGENDLRPIPLFLDPTDLDEGYVTLQRTNAHIRIWSAPDKGPAHQVLYNNDEKTWNLGDPSERTALESIKNSLFVEGVNLGESAVTAVFKVDPSGPAICRDEIKISVTPGPPREYSGWGTMTLPMAGGQIHSQWQHFNTATPPDQYRIYVDTSNAGSDPFTQGPPSGLTYTVVSPAGTYPAWDKGYIKKGGKDIGAFFIHFPARVDEGKRYWILIRSYDAADNLESQNRKGYPLIVDYPDQGGGRSDVSQIHFYVSDCSDEADVFLIQGASDICPVCRRSGATGSATLWRVARAQRREQGASAFYYADGATILTPLKNACEGSAGAFEKNRLTFGDWSDVDGNGKFFTLATGIFGSFGGYSWTWQDLNEPWLHQSDQYRNKSNFADLVYINQSVPVGEMTGIVSHELQHNIHGLADPDEELWLNESCSMYSEEVNGLGTYRIDMFSEIPLGEIAPRATKTSLSRFSMDNVWDRFDICPRCKRDAGGASTDEGQKIWIGHYEKVAIWAHYLDINITHRPGTSLHTMVADRATGISGIDHLSLSPVLQVPDGPFVRWTIANFANRVNDDPADTDYNYTGGWADVGVIPFHAAANNIYMDRVVRNLAADYIRYTHTTGPRGTLVLYLKDVTEWNKIVVNGVRLVAGDDFKDVIHLPAQTVPGVPDERRFEVPNVFGTDYQSAVIVITNIKETDVDGYKEEFKLKARIE